MAITLYGSGQNIVQVVTVSKTDVTSWSASKTWTAVSGLSLSITPASSSNKILLLATVQWSNNYGSTGDAGFTIYRNATPVLLGDAASTRSRAFAGSGLRDANEISPCYMSVVDSPATTSATTYQVYGYSGDVTSVTTYINRESGDADNSNVFRYASTLTALEIAYA